MKKLFFIILFSLFFFFPQKSFASVIHSFNVDILAHKDGTMEITELIDYDFLDVSHHGIYRYIPIYSQVGNLYRIIKISNLKVEMDNYPEDFAYSTTNNQAFLKIGDPNLTITGNHLYKISYTVSNGIGSNFEDHDEIYWNLTGNNWDVNIEKASGVARTDFGVNTTKVICFEGVVGSTESSCKIEGDNISSSKEYIIGEGLTGVWVFPVNTFPKSILATDPPKNSYELLFSFIFKNFFSIWILLNVVLACALFLWYQNHKNKKRFGPPTVNFDIPKDEDDKIIRPAIAGTIDTSRLDRNDLIATIFDLAIRKYLKFDEHKTVRKLLPDSNSVKLIKLKKADDKMDEFEKELFNYIFNDGDEIESVSLAPYTYKMFSDMNSNVFAELIKKKYYTKNPEIQRALLIFLGVISIISTNVILGIILIFLSRKLNGRTTLGDEMDYKIDGLKLFLKSMDRNYKWQVDNFYTVEQMIPYAMAFGQIDKFMKNLQINYPDYSPSWYTGYTRGGFYVAYTGFYSTVSTTIAPVSSSGSGGGGFSGGGGGGGGGGGW